LLEFIDQNNFKRTMMGVIMATDMGRHMADLNEMKAILVID
jgi:hypothetical protein